MNTEYKCKCGNTTSPFEACPNCEKPEPMNTKQLTYPSIESQKQFWIDKEAKVEKIIEDQFNRRLREITGLTGKLADVKLEAQSNNTANETSEAQRLAEAIREAIRLEDETIIREALAEYDASHLNQSASDTADPKPEDLSRTESLTDWYDHGR